MSACDLYVTGTDTGVGKTLVSAALLHALRARGLRAVGMKPVASGCERTAEGWRNEDALALRAASDPRPSYADVNPYPLPAATAPQLAAREADIAIAPAPLLAAHARLAATADRVVVEGVGGWLAPFADGFEQSQLVHALQLEVVLVVGLRLGCLSHARLSARAIAADGCRLVGWIGSGIEPDFDRDGAYAQLLRDALPAPCLGVLPHMQPPDAVAAARTLTWPPP
ncbi:dethiobiotin synthase [Luteimonas suaedae]|uniref:dethiobiotin synthase n=1 Tax=Luteimonas suaedae TaxID=2605430 RepID=UPI0011EF354E|nr:dethiobiotin synthase [Luteimonas suaedae]